MAAFSTTLVSRPDKFALELERNLSGKYSSANVDAFNTSTFSLEIQFEIICPGDGW